MIGIRKRGLYESEKIEMRSIVIAAAVVAVSGLFHVGSAFAAVEYDEHPPEAAKTQLPVYSWQDKDQKPKSVVILIHGISQRAKTLEKIATSLASNGALTYGIDLRGHGWWHHNRAENAPGFRSDYKTSIMDAEKLSRLLKDEHPDLPLILIGESVGSGVAMQAATHLPNQVDGLVVCGGGSKASKAKMFWMMAVTARGLCRRPIDIVKYQEKFASEDLIAIDKSFCDPLRRKTYTLRELMSAHSCLKKNRKFAKQLDPKISVLIVQGEKDLTVTTKSAKQVFAAVPGANKNLVIVPDCGHILLGTHNPKALVTDAITSFVSRCAVEKVAGKPADNQNR